MVGSGSGGKPGLHRQSHQRYLQSRQVSEMSTLIRNKKPPALNRGWINRNLTIRCIFDFGFASSRAGRPPKSLQAFPPPFREVVGIDQGGRPGFPRVWITVAGQRRTSLRLGSGTDLRLYTFPSGGTADPTWAASGTLIISDLYVSC